MPPITETILIVDDEPDDLGRMRSALQAEGFKVLEAGNYDTALSTFDLHREDIGILITDISLPGNNGCELARTVFKVNPDIKVLFVSGHAGAEICRFYGLSVSDFHFLRKPFAMDSMVARVHGLIASQAPLEIFAKFPAIASSAKPSC